MKRIFVLACLVLACGAAPGAAPKFKELHRFGKTAGDGADPTNVVVGKRSVLYGVTQNGGANGFGTAFSLTPPSSPGGTWKEAMLYNFAGGSDGNEPGSAVEGASGVLYGVTYYGGNFGCSEGDGLWNRVFAHSAGIARRCLDGSCDLQVPGRSYRRLLPVGRVDDRQRRSALWRDEQRWERRMRRLWLWDGFFANASRISRRLLDRGRAL